MDVEGRLLEIAVPVRRLYGEWEVLGRCRLSLNELNAANINFPGTASVRPWSRGRPRLPPVRAAGAAPADGRNPAREAVFIGGVRPPRRFALGRPVRMRDRHAGDVY